MMNIELVGQDWWVRIAGTAIVKLDAKPDVPAWVVKAAAEKVLRELVVNATINGGIVTEEGDRQPPKPASTLKTLHDALLAKALSFLPPHLVLPFPGESERQDAAALRIYEMLARNPLPVETPPTGLDAVTAALTAAGFVDICVERDGSHYRLTATGKLPEPSVRRETSADLFRSFAAANGFQAAMGLDPATAPLGLIATWIADGRFYPAFTEWCSSQAPARG